MSRVNSVIPKFLKLLQGIQALIDNFLMSREDFPVFKINNSKYSKTYYLGNKCYVELHFIVCANNL